MAFTNPWGCKAHLLLPSPEAGGWEYVQILEREKPWTASSTLSKLWDQTTGKGQSPEGSLPSAQAKMKSIGSVLRPWAGVEVEPALPSLTQPALQY